ncbi:FtsX-like permease family protein [Heliobacterium undosum]|uniref:FtsX-like permease family protein n=1 Tax=Heliomicrobium undosum TaxID=121734 RepID=A0A845KZ01_9FIRM|nr:ABC transporter permease [Heliomicrobium undosum]MZP28316.1 FtsX-like permease family protein [Heliomicrobium undosum]
MIGDTIRMALSSLLENKLRSLLTMLGIIIGVAAVVAMVSIGKGANKSVTDQIGALGSNLLYVTPGRTAPIPGVSRQARGSVSLLTLDEYELLQSARGELIAEVVPEAGRQMVVRNDRENTTTNITGTTPEYSSVRNFFVAQGRFISDYDMDNMSRVAVLGATAAADLFGAANPVGKTIRINMTDFTVIGVMENKIAGASDVGDQVFVPLTTGMKRLFGGKSLRTIVIQAAGEDVINDAQTQVERILTHKMGSASKFVLRNQQDVLTTVQGTTDTLTALLVGITGISLLVGGIGIMNIMLVSVTERTREIGIRKALGAKRFDILTQFLIESTVISSCGGVLGILTGVGLSSLLGALGNWQIQISWEAMALAFCFSAAIGIFFGLYPANRASALDPIEALRFE